MFKVWDIENKTWFSDGFIKDCMTPDGSVATACLIDTLGQANLMRAHEMGWSSSPKFKHVILQNTFRKDSNDDFIYAQYGQGAVHGDVVEISSLNGMWVICWSMFACSWQLMPLQGNLLLSGQLATLQPCDLTIIGNTCELEGLPTKVQPMVEKYLKEASREV